MPLVEVLIQEKKTTRQLRNLDDLISPKSEYDFEFKVELALCVRYVSRVLHSTSFDAIETLLDR